MIFFGALFSSLFSMTVFFRLANFALFIALIIYLYRRYIKDFITTQIKAEASVFEGLAVEQQAAMQVHERYAQLVARDVAQQAHMQRMILQWHTAVERERAVQALEKSSRLLAQKQKAEFLTDQLRKRVIAQRVMPEALLGARQQLQELFAHEQEGNSMMQHIVSTIQKSKGVKNKS